MKWRAGVKWLLITISVAIVVGAGYYGYIRFNKDIEASGSIQMTTRVTKGELLVSVSGTGSIEPHSKQTVKSTVNGTIEEVLVKEGDVVKKGDVLVRFEGTDSTSQIRSKTLSIQKAEIDLKQLQENYKTVEENSRDSLLVNIQKQQLDIEVAREELAELQEDEGADEIIAPIDGTILSLTAEVGVNVNTNAEIAQIADYEQLKIIVPVDELDISKVALGQTSTIIVEAFEDETFTGVVTAIAKEGKASNGVASFDVTVQIDEPRNIKSGMSAEASILVEQKSDILMLPIDAVQSARNSYYVMMSGSATVNGADEPGAVVQGQLPMGERPSGEQGQMPAGERPSDVQGQLPMGGNFAGRGQGTAPPGTGTASSGTRVMVEVGIANEDFIEIVSGLNEGDTVILPTSTAASSSTMMMQGSFPGVMPSGSINVGGREGFTGGGGGSGMQGGGR
jgi:HlyD family secretion protein